MTAIVTVCLALAPFPGEIAVRVGAAGGQAAGGSVVRVELVTPPEGYAATRSHGPFGGRLEHWKLRADAGGNAHFRDLPPGTYAVLASDGRGSYAARGPVDLFGDETAIAELALRPGWTAQGRVTDVAGEPIAQASVWGQTELRMGVAPRLFATTTDGDGRWSVDGLPPKEFLESFGLLLRAQAPGHMEAGGFVEAFRHGDEGLREENLELPRAALLPARLLDLSCKPLVGAVVGLNVYPEEWPNSANTDAGGRVVLERYATSCPHELHVRHRGEDWVARRVDPSSDDFVLDDVAVVTGTVVDQTSGAPLAGVLVALVEHGNTELALGRAGTTAPDGRFAVRAAEGGWHVVRARLAGYSDAASERLNVTRGARTEPVVLALRSLTSVRGRCVDAADGEPLRGVLVLLQAPPMKGQRLDDAIATTHVARTDADGSFELPNVQLIAHELELHHPRYVPLDGIELESSDASTRDLGTLKLQRGVVVRGIVRDAGGAPVPFRGVTAHGARGGGPQTRTNAEGRFRFLGLERDALRLRVRTLADEDPRPRRERPRWDPSMFEHMVPVETGDADEVFVELTARDG